jgi:16S rRNA (guanine527-N7)-methyltransferase
VAQFWAFHQLLRERNIDSDLTRLHAFDTIVLKHYVDSALVATLVDLPSPLLDLGSGAGFPGIPLKIVRPDVQVFLGEPRGRRVEFLEEAVRRLGTTGIEVVPRRIGARFDHPVRGVITRAVEPIAATLARVAPWLEPGGRVLFMKGPGVDAEVEAAKRDWSGSFRVTLDLPYTIPGTPHARRLVVLERLAGADAARRSPEGAGAAPHAGDARETRAIGSAANPTFKLLRAVLARRGIRKHQLALLAGARPVLEVLRDFPDRARAWVTPSTAAPPPSGAPSALAWYRLQPALFREIDVHGTGGPLLLVDAPPLAAWSDEDWPAGCTLFVPFQDPENVGAVLRTAAAFGAARAVLLQEAAHPFHPRSARAAGSALLRVPLLRGPSIADLAPRGAPVFALSTSGRDAGACEFPARFGLLPGLEGPGLPEAWRTAEALAIPMQPGNESLNAATATAIVLYLWARRRLAGGSDSC